jgi:6-pyruvoyltetrahydropterin/6-carboxytetrahydropterin synthase
MNITKIFTFDSAHHLIDYVGKCRNIHGHTYKLEVTVRGAVLADGIVIDFHTLDDIVEKEILSQIDHRYLNEVLDFNPTCELVGLWIWDECEKRLNKDGITVEKIVLWETPTCFVTIDKE